MSAISRAKWSLLALGAGLSASAWLAFPYAVDDAYITARYAQRVASGFGYTFNDGVVTDGVTGPLWLVPMLVALGLGLDPLWGAKIVGLACSLGAASSCVMRARQRASGAWLAAWTAGLSATSVSLSVWSVGGLETGAGALAFTGMALATTARARPRGGLLGVCIALAAWLRPELCFAAFACLVCVAMRDRGAFVRALGLGGLGALALLAFRMRMFGHVLPLSAHAKPAELMHGLGYLGGALSHLDAWLGLALVALAVRAGQREDRMHAAVLFAHVLGCVLAGGDWMPGFRLFAPLVPLSALTLASGARSLRARRPWGAELALGSLLLWGAFGMLRELPAVRAAGENRQRQMPSLVKAVAEPRGSIMAVDVGALGYFTRVQMFDLGGLVTPEVAHARGGHLDKKIDEAWVERSRPTWLVLHSALRPVVGPEGSLHRFAGYPVERRVARMPFVRTHYRVRGVQRYGDGYFYVILAFQAPVDGQNFTP